MKDVIGKVNLVVLVFLLCLGIYGVVLLNEINHSSSTKMNATAYNEKETSHYDVIKRSEQINVDGVLEEGIWNEVPDLSGSFHFPWEQVEAPYTSFKAYHDDKNFYFSFVVKDQEVLVDDNWKDDESTVDNEDRVELFFAGNAIDKPGAKGMERYYAFEVDPKGRVHDYSVEYYRQFDSKWNMEGLTTKAKTMKDGYVVEGSVPIKTLNDLKLINTNMVMRTGIYRAEFSKPKSGDEPMMQWISWVDPKTPEPDYHVDSSFGELRFLP